MNHIIFIALLFVACTPDEPLPACVGEENTKARTFLANCYEQERYALVSCFDQMFSVYLCEPGRVTK